METKTRVINFLKHDGILPKDMVYIGRAFKNDVWILKESIFHNPFKLRRNATEQERKECIEKYEAYLRSKPDLLSKIETLRGKTLACFCKPKLCHGDVIEKILNEQKN